MEINVLEESSKKIVFEIKGEGHSMLNSLKRTLWQNKHVKIATYAIDHPLVGIPKMTVETDGEVKPRKAILEAAEKLQKETVQLKKDISKLK